MAGTQHFVVEATAASDPPLTRSKEDGVVARGERDDLQSQLLVATQIIEGLEYVQRSFFTQKERLQQMKLYARRQTDAAKSLRLEVMELDQSEITLLARVFGLTCDLEVECHAHNSSQLKLIQLEDDKEVTLRDNDDLRSQLDFATQTVDDLELSLKQAESARDLFCGEEKRLEKAAEIERQKCKHLGEENARIKENHKAIVEEKNMLSAALFSEQQTAVKLGQN
ncbi:hypothetical protein EG329_010107 [Mollisiaceae sp. DMI_Dod_QoI]|nr:hypothetical protein EG329_010107 [Helotiales sp. DMI_Dod_QoI]